MSASRRSYQQPADHPRPAERILEHGPEAVTDAEALSVVLGHRGPEAARRILRDAGGLAGLPDSWNGSTVAERRLSPATVARLLAAVELAGRIARAKIAEREPLSHPDAVARYLGLKRWRSGQEVMGALYLDTRNRLLAERELFRGTLNRAAVAPRPILREGLARSAAGLILYHTHPSGDPSPSAKDLAFTRRLAEAGEVVGLRVVDHLIVCPGGAWVSLRKRGGW